MNPSPKRVWQVRAAALVVFLLGFVAGALALDLYAKAKRGSGSAPRHRIGRVLDELGLSPEQRERVDAIFADARTDMAEVRRECGPKFREVRQRTDAKLREVHIDCLA